MQRPGWGLIAVVVLGAVLAGAEPGEAQTLATFRWQLAPLDEVVTLTVVQLGGVFVLSGFADSGGQRAAAYGTAFVTPAGLAGLGFTTVFDGIAVTTTVTLNPATLAGPWRDDAGNSGTFTPRP